MQQHSTSHTTTYNKLNQFFATAICGNDILSSVLYVSGIAILFAGIYAPIVLLLVVGVLLLYKSVYTEVVEALPINGGAYNCLLNATSKKFAAVAGVMTILSYVATAVISAKIGVEYLNSIISIPIIPLTIGLLFVFALLVISGMKDSAKIATIIFSAHILILVSFLFLGLIYFLKGGNSYFVFNLHHTGKLITNHGGILITLYLAFSASLLGISGFESSANFVEEQKKGVFRKTLRNMLVGVAVFNPLIAVIVLNSMSYDAIIGSKDFLLAQAAYTLGGPIFKYFVVFDAFFVLSGAVLTAYIGISGLVHRMALDSTLPISLARQSKRGSYPRIIISFFLLCSSILLITRGNLLSLAGVYTISFLGVMSLFALGNLILKRTRKSLKRTYRAPLLIVMIALLSTLIGIFGNIRIDQQNLVFFEMYFIPTIAIVLLVIYQDYLIKFALKMTKRIQFFHHRLKKYLKTLTKEKVIVFVRSRHRIGPILDYIKRNEMTNFITLIVCAEVQGGSNRGEYLKITKSIPYLKKAGLYKNFKIKVVYYSQPFDPKAIDEVARYYKVMKNKIFIGSIHHLHSFSYGDFGGVRIIF